MKKVMKVQMDAVLESQSLARSVAAAYVAELDPTIDELTEVKTAVSEAVGNAAIHAYPGELSGKVTMEFCLIAEDTIMIKVSDRGVGIENIAKAMEPLFTTDKGDLCSGMGFTVMESFMDKIRVDSTPGEGTIVTMVKKLDTYYGF